MEDRRFMTGMVAALLLALGIGLFVAFAVAGGRFSIPTPNSPQLFLVILVGLAVAATLIAIIAASAGQKKKGKASRLGMEARDLGLDVRELESHHHTLPFTGHEHLKHKKPKIKKIMEASLDDGRPITFFEHTYIVMAGQTPAPVVHRVVVADVPVEWSALRIKKRVAPRWLSRIFGKPTIALELEDFNRKYALICKDHDFAIAFMEPDFQAWLVNQTPAADWYIEQGRLAYVESGSLKAKDLAGMRERLQGFIQQIPPLFGLHPPVTVAPEASAAFD